MNERDNIDYPIWRKKVDSSLLNTTVTPIPKWLWGIWEIEKIFANVNSKRAANSKVRITFEKAIYKGNVTLSKQSNGRSFCRLHLEPSLHSVLKERFFDDIYALFRRPNT
jgi:hypothetical protein